MEIFKSLSEHFKQLGLKQSDIALACGWRKSFVSELLNGKRVIGEDTALKLNKMYGFDIHWLLTGEGEMLRVDATASATDGMSEEALKGRITALEKLLDERDARIADLEGRQEERLNAMQGNIDSLTEALNKALDLVKSTK